MQLTSRINEAIKLSSRLHRNQTRKDEHNTPYVSHLFAVAVLISSVTDDEDIIIAGLMHDALEDVPHYTYDQLVTDFGERVAYIVKHVTEPLDATREDIEQLPWLERKEIYLKVLQQGGKESAIVSAADKIHNTESFIMNMTQEGESFTSRFPSSLRNKVWFHEQVLSIVTEKLGNDHPLIVRLSSCTKRFRDLAFLDGDIV
jgi:(p)ppGpp synthase/HD superfamily hydrolase